LRVIGGVALQSGEGRAGQQLDFLVEKTHPHALLGAALTGRRDAGAQGARWLANSAAWTTSRQIQGR
jgi:hypothetical protein